MAPTLSHFVSFAAPRGGRISPWDDPAAKTVMAPTLSHFVSFAAPPGGPHFALGRPGGENRDGPHALALRVVRWPCRPRGNPKANYV